MAPANNPSNEEEEEEDYMSMTIVEPPKPAGGKETYTQRRLRKQREVCQNPFYDPRSSAFLFVSPLSFLG